MMERLAPDGLHSWSTSVAGTRGGRFNAISSEPRKLLKNEAQQVGDLSVNQLVFIANQATSCPSHCMAIKHDTST